MMSAERRQIKPIRLGCESRAPLMQDDDGFSMARTWPALARAQMFH